MEQPIGLPATVDHRARRCPVFPAQFQVRGGLSEGKGGPTIDNVQGRYASEDLRANMLPIQGCPPQQQLWGEQPPIVGVTQFVPHPPFPPPVPRASPEQLLQETRPGLSGYELTRLVAIEATQRVLSKHLSEMAAIGERMSLIDRKG